MPRNEIDADKFIIVVIDAYDVWQHRLIYHCLSNTKAKYINNTYHVFQTHDFAQYRSLNEQQQAKYQQNNILCTSVTSAMLDLEMGQIRLPNISHGFAWIHTVVKVSELSDLDLLSVITLRCFVVLCFSTYYTSRTLVNRKR